MAADEGPKTPDDVNGLYEAWVTSLKRDKDRASSRAISGWAAAGALLVVLLLVLALTRRGPVYVEHEDDGPEGEEAGG